MYLEDVSADLYVAISRVGEGCANAITASAEKVAKLLQRYTVWVPEEGLKGVEDKSILGVIERVVQSIQWTIDKAIRIVLKNIARTYMVLKTYFELILSVPVTAGVLFINEFLRTVADLACKIAERCIGVVAIVLTIPYAIKKLRKVVEQEYDITKPLTSLRNIVKGFGKAVRDILTVLFVSLIAGATVCVFAKCPKLEALRPPFIALPDWYIFEDFCADLCREPLIRGDIRAYADCIRRCVEMISPRRKTEVVIVRLLDRVIVRVNEWLGSADITAPKPWQPIVEHVRVSDVVTTSIAKQSIESVLESIVVESVFPEVAMKRIDELVTLSDEINTVTRFREVRELSESTTIGWYVDFNTPSVSTAHVYDSLTTDDKMPTWILLPPISSYARWIEAVTEYIDPYHGVSAVAYNTLTGEVIRVGEIGRSVHSYAYARDVLDILAKPAIRVYIADEARAEDFFGLAKLATLTSPEGLGIRTTMIHSAREVAGTELSAENMVMQILVEAVKWMPVLVELTSPTRLDIRAIAVHSTRMMMGVELASPERLGIRATMVHSTRMIVGVELTSPARLGIKTVAVHSTREVAGAELTSPSKQLLSMTLQV